MATLATGFFFDKPRENAPEFVKGKLSIKVEDAIKLLQGHKNEKGYSYRPISKDAIATAVTDDTAMKEEIG